MPELPEVETIRRSLAPALLGRRVEAVEARPVRLRHGIDPAEWQTLLGRTAERLERRGKYLLLRFGSRTALLHLGMSGRLRACGGGDARDPHTHLVACLDDGRELRFVDPRRFGAAIVVASDEIEQSPLLARLGPDPLSEAAEAALRARASTSRAPIRSLLLDQSVLAGLGNIYASEALARAGIAPLRPARSLSKARLRGLAAAVRAVLEDALRAGGTTLADGGFVDAAGDAGRFVVDLAVYGREGQPCRRCGAPIRRRVSAGRSAFDCPRCQR